MERLTERWGEDDVWVKDHDYVTAAHRLAGYEDTGLEPEEVLPKDKADEIALKLMSQKKENEELAEQLKSQTAKTIALRNDLMAKMHSNAVRTEKIDQMNGEAITRENEIANLKADADVLRNKLTDTEAALGRANDECAFKQEVLNVMRNRRYNAEQRANYAEAHPWRNLLAWVKRKLKMA